MFIVDLVCKDCGFRMENVAYDHRSDFKGFEVCDNCEGVMLRSWSYKPSKAIWKAECPTASGGK